jgi:hypothetical protein
MPNQPTTTFILGAGFSHYAGLPLQSDFTKDLLAARDFDEGPSKSLVNFLSKFVHLAFDHARTAPAQFWPQLEDIFTCIDLSANSGHHLGPNLSPSELRTVRRALISRIIRTLAQDYNAAEKTRGTEWQALDAFLEQVVSPNSSFISLNWDTVLEQRLSELFPSLPYSYGSTANAADFSSSNDHIATVSANMTSAVPIVKMHGSINWLYCDNCQRCFWFPPSKWPQIANQLLSPREWTDIDPTRTHHAKQYKCNRCQGVFLSTRIATFSYRKALDFPMFHRSWLYAEQLLRKADTWVFIGYSLPAADYEFKHLLKRIQLSKRRKIDFVVVTGGPIKMAEQTSSNYQKFFWRKHKEGPKRFPSRTNREIGRINQRNLTKNKTGLPRAENPKAAPAVESAERFRPPPASPNFHTFHNPFEYTTNTHSPNSAFHATLHRDRRNQPPAPRPARRFPAPIFLAIFHRIAL